MNKLDELLVNMAKYQPQMISYKEYEILSIVTEQCELVITYKLDSSGVFNGSSLEQVVDNGDPIFGSLLTNIINKDKDLHVLTDGEVLILSDKTIIQIQNEYRMLSEEFFDLIKEMRPFSGIQGLNHLVLFNARDYKMFQ